jgi:hypothetical protein
MSNLDRKLLAELLLEIKKLNAALDRQGTIAPVAADQWEPGTIAWQKLKAVGVQSANHLKQLRLDGVITWERGEIRNVSRGDRPTWQYNIPKCQQAIQSYFDRQPA